MKKTLLLIAFITGTLIARTQPQGPPDTIPPGSKILAWYEGRTPCKEMAVELQLPVSEQCAKRKLSLTLYVNAVTGEPTFYKMRGIGIRSGMGKWSIEKGIPTDPQALVYRLSMGTVNLLLLKGDEQVLFVLDKDKHFLVGNAKFSYTLNRVITKQSWTNWRNLLHRGLPF